jgi:hypothetical protein
MFTHDIQVLAKKAVQYIPTLRPGSMDSSAALGNAIAAMLEKSGDADRSREMQKCVEIAIRSHHEATEALAFLLIELERYVPVNKRRVADGDDDCDEKDE